MAEWTEIGATVGVVQKESAVRPVARILCVPVCVSASRWVVPLRTADRAAGRAVETAAGASSRQRGAASAIAR